MTPAEWRDLRDAIATLDEWLDAVALERHAARKDTRNE